MIFLEISVSVGLMTGSLLSSFIHAASNATVIFVISSIFMGGATVFIWLCVPESLNIVIPDKNGDEQNPSHGEKKDTDTEIVEQKPQPENVELGLEKLSLNSLEENGKKKEEQETEKEATKSKTVTSVFSLIHIKDMWITCFKARPKYDRCIVLLVTGTMFLVIFVWGKKKISKKIPLN